MRTIVRIRNKTKKKQNKKTKKKKKKKKNNNKCPPTQSRQRCHSCTQHVISSCSIFVSSIIETFRNAFVLQSRDKKSNSNTRRGDNSKSKKKAKVVILVCDMSSGHIFITTTYHQNIPKSVDLQSGHDINA